MCTRIDKALREEKDEPPLVLSSGDLPDCSDDEDVTNSDILTTDITDSDKEQCNLLQYSTRIHERVFDSLVTEEFLTGKQSILSHDQCSFFHAVSAYATQLTQVEDKNLFVRDVLKFEECLSEIIVENLSFHVKDALEELIAKQIKLMETMFVFKVSHARKAIVAQNTLQFIIKIEKRVYQELKNMTAENHLSQLEKMIKEVKDACLLVLPQQAGTQGLLLDKHETNSKQDEQAANQVREFVCDKFNERFCKRVRDQMKVLDVTEIVERCVKGMQDQVKSDLQAVRIVTTIVKAAYIPVSKAATVKRGLPFKLILIDFFRRHFTSKEPMAKYTKEWKETVAEHFLLLLDPKELARAYCTNIQDTLEKAHAEFESSIVELEAAKQNIVEEARGQQHQIRISDVYHLANVFLESKSFLGFLQHGMPEKEDAIGKGPTSTVYKCIRGSWSPSADVILKAREPWPPVSKEFWSASLYLAM